MGKPEGKGPLGNHGVDGKILLIGMLKNRMGMHGLDESMRCVRKVKIHHV